VNDAPVAANDSATTLEDTVVTIPVLTNDSDVDGDALSAALASSPAHGTLTLNANGSFTYTPTGNFSGSDSFTYRASDGTVVSNLATVSLTVNSVNDAPVAANDSATTLEDTVVTIPVLTNDSDVDGDALSAALVGGPDHGTLTLNANGSFTYTPAANFNGNDTFVYRASDGIDLSNLATVSITVNSVNDAPVVANDNYSVNEDAVLVVNAPGVLANDSDVDGDTLSAALASGPVHGTLTLNANGSFTYTPAANFNGNDTFTYRASDGTVLSSLATVSITVDSVNDAPVAANDSHSMNENQTLTIPASAGVLANDSDVDGDTLSAILASGPAHGTLTLNANGSFTYTPAADFTGSDAFTYHASDGTAPSSLATVSIAVNPANNAPVAVNDDATTLEDTAVTIPVLANDSGVDGATLSISAASVNTPGAGSVVVNANGTLTFTPAPNFNGTIALNYTVRDSNAETASAFVTVAITPVNDAPVATNDSYSVNEDQTLTIPAGAGVLANDTDVDVDTLSAALASVPAHGTLTLNPNGSFTYTPTANFDGSDFFTYRAADGVETSNFATVSITVNSVNHVPVAMNDSIATNGNTAVTIDVLANDTDPDGDALTVSAITTAPTNGTASIVSDKAVYTPATGFTGTDNFAVRISDGNGGSATSTVTVMVNNRPPVALDDSATTSAGTPVNIAVLANDSDPDSHSLTVASVSAPASGTAAIMADGQITYTPPASDFAGSSFTYVVSDGHGGSATATVRVAVGATTSNALPIARDDIYTSEEVGPATIAVLANDSDPDGDTLSVSSVTQGTTGSVILNADGTVTYTPGSSFSRLDKFTVTIGDGHGGSATSHVAILMSPFVNGGSIYDGLLENPAPTGPNSGYVTVHVTRPGAFTAQIFSAGHLARFRGAFDAASNFKTSIRRRDGVQIAVALHFDLPNNRFTGTVSDGTNISAILATAFPWSKLFPTPRFGRYTMLIQADEAAGVPSSFGCATAQVLKRGLVRIIGRTADGIPFVSQTWLDANGDSFEIYAGLSNVKARGRIFGRVSFEDVPGVSDIAGTLIWDKPKRPSSLSSKGQYYTDGFTVAATCLGSTYSAPSGSRVLPLADALPNAMLALSGADFAPQLAAPLALSPHNVATVVGANPQGVTLAIKRTTGAFTGRGSLPGGTPRKFIFGVIFQKQKVGAGFFRGTAETGTVTISAP
jgi:VCBS repeat-containing protein